MHTFKVGDVVRRIKGDYQGMVVGDTGMVTVVSVDGIKFSPSYTGQADVFHSNGSFEHVTISAQAPPPVSPSVPVAVAVSDDDLTYDERKAQAPVCSSGKFRQGNKLRYCDGTTIPNGEARTVVRCTATCVWFEETYSMPFNPNEFELEY